MFPAISDGIFMVFIGFALVLHGYRHFCSTIRCYCGRQSPEVKKREMLIFVHFYSPASDRLGRLSCRIRGLLGGLKTTLYGFFDIFPGCGRNIVPKSLNFAKSALLEASLMKYNRRLPKVRILQN